MESSLVRLTKFERVLYYPVAIVATALFFLNLQMALQTATPRTVGMLVLSVIEIFVLWALPFLVKNKIWPVRAVLWPLSTIMILWVVFTTLQYSRAF